MSVGAEPAGGGRPKFRENLVAQPVEEAGVKWVEVSDPSSGKSFRFYDFEYLVASAMDGTRDAQDLVLHARTELGFETTPADLTSFVSELERLGYVTREAPSIDDDAHDRPTSLVDPHELQRRAQESMKSGMRPMPGAPVGPMGDETSFEGLIEDTNANKPSPLLAAARASTIPTPPPVPDEPNLTPLPPALPIGDEPRDSSQSEIRVDDEPTATREPGERLLNLARPSADVLGLDPRSERELPPAASLVAAPPPSRITELLPEPQRPPPTPPMPPMPPPTPSMPPPVPQLPRIDGAERMVLPPKQPQKQPVKPVTPLPSAEEPRKSNVVLYLLLLLVVAAGAAVYYFKVLKKKKEPGGQVVSPTPTQSGSPKPTQPPKSNLSPALATMRPDPASLHSPGAKLEATGGGATDHAAATTAGKVDWLVADGSVVAVGEPVAKLDGWKGPEKKFLDREKSLRDKQDKMTRLQAKDPPDPKAIASQQKEIDRVAGELQAARDKYEPFLIKAPLAGPTKALIEEGDEVTAGQDVVQVGGGSPAVIATFELSEKDRFKVGETANLLVDGKLTSATVDGVDGDKVRVRIASAPLPPAGAMAQLLKSDADPNKGQVVIPAAALHGDYVLMAKDGKVVKVAVNGKVDGAEAVIESGVNAGDTVLLGDGKEGDPAP